MKNKQTLNEVLRGHGMANMTRQSTAVPAVITRVYGDVVDVKPLQSPVRYDDKGHRNDITEPLDYEGVKCVAGIFSAGDGVYIPPKVGMSGIFLVADFEGDGVVEHAAVRQRSSGWFIPCEQVTHDDSITLKYGSSKIILTQSGIDIIDAGGNSLVDAVKELNAIVSGCCGSSSPSAEGFSK